MKHYLNSRKCREVEKLPPTIEWRDEKVYILDQTQLPHRVAIEKLNCVEDMWCAIKDLRVRGAPLIGVAAAYGVCLAMQSERSASSADFREKLENCAAYLNTARPTAVNLSKTLERMRRVVMQIEVDNTAILYDILLAEAVKIHAEDCHFCDCIGAHGLSLIASNYGVLTHCNAGALATTGIGTATAPIYLAHQQGIHFKVYASETRPLLQGARLTALELQRSGVDVTLITDNMAATVMSQGKIDLVIVGADHVAANGDFANKIGTLGIAIQANYFGIPFYVACPSSTLGLQAKTGADIVIEQRQGNEVRRVASRSIAPIDIKVCNPAFDITPHGLVTGIITERGIIRPPIAAGLATFL
ncbi:S-methyl-5-thioribose-1-phosphate isomerase [Burkholderia sp. TSV86]|uniref:S-methyl-5-thioribose-1-phosphate isomerase n=1 Tax=Burkholderia sp. TSV86 TaxID=1385594 RepID=UPI0007536795|nr:S-methyl-5-thioribose-1-phosphate isomerase [Burkholderia sp. TSV86]KVE34310.1 methylthioribose-1-phosphate isomerase [Burkholderia sp. TSV86]